MIVVLSFQPASRYNLFSGHARYRYHRLRLYFMYERRAKQIALALTGRVGGEQHL